MKRLITLAMLIIGTLSCVKYGFYETFDHCNDEPISFEKIYAGIDTGRACRLPWHEHNSRDEMSLTHVDGNIYTLNCFGFTLETLRDGCDFTIIEQELEISGVVAKFSGTGKHSRVKDYTSGPPGFYLKFDIDYMYNGVESNCSFNGSNYD